MATELTIFSKKRTNREGRTFYNYLTTLTRKSTGEAQTFSVKFKGDTNPDPEDCPMNIIVEKNDCNAAARQYTDDEGEVRTGYTLWVSAWKPGSEYVDHSLDDFEI